MKKMRWISILLIIVLMLSGCAGSEEEVYDNPGITYEGVSEGRDSESTSDEQTDTESGESKPTEQQQPEADRSEDEDEDDTPVDSDTEKQPTQSSDDEQTPSDPSDETTTDTPATTPTDTEKKDDTVVDIETDLRWFGRTYTKGGVHYFNWTESGFEFTFDGTGAEATFECYSNYSSNFDKHVAYIVVYIDGKDTGKSIRIAEGAEVVTLCSGLKKGTHTVRVVKRTNARSSYVGLQDITLLKNGTIQAPPTAKSRRIEFVGDSLTVGYGALGDSSTAEWSTETESGAVTYAALAAKSLNAEYNVIAVSGRGLAHNTGGDTDKLMPALYTKLDEYNNPGVDWDFSSFVPDVIVINLGTNDHSTSTEAEVTAATTAFLKTVRQKNPNSYIIFAYGLNSSAKMENAIKSGVQAVGDAKISYFSLGRPTATSIGHPTAAAHKVAAVALEAEIRRVTGWKD